jgi:hypothetical protein
VVVVVEVDIGAAGVVLVCSVVVLVVLSGLPQPAATMAAVSSAIVDKSR